MHRLNRSILKLTIPSSFSLAGSRSTGSVLFRQFSEKSTPSPAHNNGAPRVTLEEAKRMPKDYPAMPNDILLTMAVMGDQEAREERMMREIMSVDNLSWEKARPIFLQMVRSNRTGLFVATLPYRIGIIVAVSAGFVSIPMIFDLNTVLWFNELYVTTDVPEDKDLETPLEVGSWAWNWMEPPLGQISFFLLCMQYARSQMENLGVKPYTAFFKHRRAQRLCREFPRYNKDIVMSFSEGDSLVPSTHPEIKS